MCSPEFFPDVARREGENTGPPKGRAGTPAPDSPKGRFGHESVAGLSPLALKGTLEGECSGHLWEGSFRAPHFIPISGFC